VVVYSQAVGGSNGPIQIEPNTLKLGIYQAVVRDDGRVTGTGKFVIAR
jgi:hypothetical protein